MFCTSCGAKLDDDARFCTGCGKPLAGNEGPGFPPVPATGTTSNAAPTAAPARLRFWIPALVFASICLGVYILRFLVLAFNHGSEVIYLNRTWNFITSIPWIPLSVFGALFHYGCWKWLPARHAQLTPGKAVGLLFVPVFNLYWAFPSFEGLGRGFRKLAEERGSKEARNLPVLGTVIAALCFAQIVLCNVIAPILMGHWAASLGGAHMDRWDREFMLGRMIQINAFVSLCFSIAVFVIALLFYRRIRRLTADPSAR